LLEPGLKGLWDGLIWGRSLSEVSLLYIAAPYPAYRFMSLRRSSSDQEGKSLSSRFFRRCLRWQAVLDIFGNSARVNSSRKHGRPRAASIHPKLVYNEKEGKILSGGASRRCLRWQAVLDIFGSSARVNSSRKQIFRTYFCTKES
jgi:hypothetical protein